MSFWDSSAILPLVVQEPYTADVHQIRQRHGLPVVWWASLVECQSAIERRNRASEMSTEQKRQALHLLEQLAAAWSEVQPAVALRERSLRLLSVHNLCAADALQLAAALIWSGERPRGRVFVSLDSRLRESAGQEGFTVLPEALGLL